MPTAIHIHLFFNLLLLVFFIGCNRPSETTVRNINMPKAELPITDTRGALLSTRFKSFEELKKVIKIEYLNTNSSSDIFNFRKPEVRLTFKNNDQEITSILKAGISESDFECARDGGFLDRIWLCIKSPYAVRNRKDLLGVYTLARRDYIKYGVDDVAFYNIAETMLYNISDDDLVFMPSEDLSEKGYLNTFNHITAQAFMTSIFSEELADFIADSHERSNMPESISGIFTNDQLTDLEKGPVDNYVDIINNELGQELGKTLKKKYCIIRTTYWTPELLANYLNDIQSYYSWAFQIGFKPFKAADEKVIGFSKKINSINVSSG